MARSLGDRLAASRRAGLVGREQELGSLGGLLDDSELVLTYVHGPGGVGKSSLLDAFAAEAGHRDRHVVWLDCADLESTAGGFETALFKAASVTEASGLPSETILVVDRFEDAWELAGWFWRTLVPSLPDGVQVVAAGRRPPPPGWLADPAFTAHAAVLPLRNLTPDDAATLARSRGLGDDESVAALVRATRGHPLAIVIGTDSPTAGSPSGGPTGVLEHPDAVARLLARFLEESITPVQRDALHVCGRARRVDRGLLARVLGLDDAAADAALAWLRERPYAESHPDGLALHDLVRDTLDQDLRWRDREAFAHLHLAIRDVITARMAAADGAEHARWARDLLHLNRGNPGARDLFGFDTEDLVVGRGVRSEDHLWLVEAFEAEGRGAAAAYWLELRPDALTVFEDADGQRCGAALIAVTDAAGLDDAARHDPVAAWVATELQHRRPPEAHEVLLHQLVTITDPRRSTAVGDAMATMALRAWRTRGLGWSVLGTADEERWGPTWTYIGYERLGICVSNGVEVSVWARDFLLSPFAEWLAGMAAQELDHTGSAPAPRSQPVALARADFGAAVRLLVKDLHHPDRVRRNPLVHSRLADRAGGDPVQVLRDRLRSAVAVLSAAPKLDVAARALDRTYLRPAGSQERAAEVLDLPFSTYRRHLGTGLDRLEALLWDWELHGPPAPD